MTSMSEQTRYWKTSGGVVTTHLSEPDGSWVELVPQSEADAVKAELAEAKAETKRHERELRDLFGGTHPTMVVRNRSEQAVAPSLPVHGTPEALRWAADEIDHANGAPELADLPQSAWKLRVEADRLEAERVREATHTAAIEATAKVLYDTDLACGANTKPWDQASTAQQNAYYNYSRALIDAGADLTGLVDGAEA